RCGRTAQPQRSSATVRRLRPLARRRFSTIRPFLVDIRTRNPCAFFRRREFGWYVRLPFIVRSCEGPDTASAAGMAVSPVPLEGLPVLQGRAHEQELPPRPDETSILIATQQECQRRRSVVQGTDWFVVFPKISTTVENTVEKRQSRMDSVIFPRIFSILEHILKVSRARTAKISGAFAARPQ